VDRALIRRHGRFRDGDDASPACAIRYKPPTMVLATKARKRSIGLIAISAVLLLGAVLAPGAGAATLYVCVKKGSGTARFVNARTKCRRNETKLAWNIAGPAGRNGATGKNGSNGKNGTNGKDGAAGKNGTNGANGASAGLIDSNDSVFELPVTRATIATLPNVPPGSYIVTGKVQVEDANPAEGVTVHCYLAGDEARAELQPKGGSATLSLITAGVTLSTTAFPLECNDFGTAGVKVAFARIAAIQVQTLSATTG
jgi:hypothetical protein